ncbi:7568_t:CDS:2, partial [Scutellospora calospora]
QHKEFLASKKKSKIVHIELDDKETNQQDSTFFVKDTEPETSQIDKTLENSSSNMKDLNSENLVVEKENTEASSVRTLDNSNKENIATKNIQTKTAMEIEDSNSSRTPIVLITNNNKSHLQTKNLEEGFITKNS